MDYIRKVVRKHMETLANWLNVTTHGKITPTQVTVASLLLHVLIFVAIVSELYPLAAIMVVVFGLMDSLDGALARVQGKESNTGMLLDASTDRMKEALIFMALAYRFAVDGESLAVLGAVAAVTGAFCVSYIKAKGETAVRKSKLTTPEINRLFQAGLMRYEVRMAALAFGLLFSSILIPMVWVIAALSWLTAFWRLMNISVRIRE
jgi:CDP-diacylglycerol--glycerol-3-phosphate 3-phosphatidyltransferase